MITTSHHQFDLAGASATEFYDDCETFLHNRFFSAHFGCFPSTFSVVLKVEGSYETYCKLVGELDLHRHDDRLAFRDWSIPEIKHEGTKRSYPNESYFVSQTEKLLIRLFVNGVQSVAHFHYDCRDRALEKRLLALAERLRGDFYQPEKAVFYVLSVNAMHFSTTEIEIKPVAIDLARHYNDDFTAVDGVIKSSIAEERSGLILLHGLPGTGKTSYIKHLICEHPDQEIIFIPNDFVGNMLEPGFIRFLLSKKDSILVIEDAEKVIMSRADTGQNSVVSTILQITDGLFSDFLNIKVICTFNTDVSRIDKALFRKGRMIAFYEFGELTQAKARAIVGPDVALPKTLTLAELYNMEHDNFQEEAAMPSRRIGFGG